jgi:hypothetical protein
VLEAVPDRQGALRSSAEMRFGCTCKLESGSCGVYKRRRSQVMLALCGPRWHSQVMLAFRGLLRMRLGCTCKLVSGSCGV